MTSSINFRLLLGSIYIPALLTAIAQNTTLVLLPLYVLHLGYDPSIAAMVFAARALGTLAGDIPGGKLIEQFGDKKAMLLGAGFSAASYFGIALSTDVSGIAILCFLGGFSSSCSLLGRQSFLTGRFKNHQRGRIIGLLGGVVRGGSLIGPAAGGVLTLIFGYNIVFFVLAALCVVAFVLVFRFAESSNDHRQRANGGAKASLLDILINNRRVFLTAGIATIGLQFMRSVRSLLVPLVGASIGLEVDTLGLIVSAGAAIDILMVYPTGHIMDRFGRKTAAVPAFLIFSIALTLLSTVSSTFGLLLVAVLMGLANGLTAGLVLVLGSDYAPKSNRGPFLGVWRLVSDVGSVSSPTTVGIVLKIASLSATGAIAGLIGLTATAVLFWTVREPLKPEEPPGKSRDADPA